MLTVEEDLERVAAVREALGPKVSLQIVVVMMLVLVTMIIVMLIDMKMVIK